MSDAENVLYLVPRDIVNAWRDQIRTTAADNPKDDYVRQADVNLRQALADTSGTVQERAYEAADKLGEYLQARKVRNAPPPPLIPPPPPQAHILQQQWPQPQPQPQPPAVPAPAPAPAPVPVPPPIPMAMAPAPAQAPQPPQQHAIAPYVPPQGDAIGDLDFDPQLMNAVRPSYRPRVQRLLRAILESNQPGVTFGDRVGQVFVDGQPIPGLAKLLNDATSRRAAAYETSSPGFERFRRLLRGTTIPPKLLSDPYRQIVRAPNRGGDSPSNWQLYNLPGTPPRTPLRPSHLRRVMHSAGPIKGLRSRARGRTSDRPPYPGVRTLRWQDPPSS